MEEGVKLTLPAALAWEQGVEGEPVTSDPTSANLDVVAAGDGWDLTVSVADDWLEGKTFPVVLDPTLTYSANSGRGPTLEGYAVRNTSSCGSSCRLTRDSRLFAGSWGWANPVRSYLRYDLSAIPSDARIDSASLNFYITSCMNLSTPSPCANKTWLFDAVRMTGDWNASSTFAELEAATSSAICPCPLIKPDRINTWMELNYLESIVQRWVNGSSPNYGFAMRSVGGEANDRAGLAFASSRVTSNFGQRPYLKVSYTVVAPYSPEVTALAGNGAARVHWGIPNSGGSPITSYLVKAYRSGTFVKSNYVYCPCPTVAAVDGLANGTGYTFTVQARNAVGYSAAATSGVVTPSADLPTAPNPASASPGNAAATLSWHHPATGAGDVDHYLVQAFDPDTGSIGGIVLDCPCATTASVGVLLIGGTYILAVYAHNAAGYSVPALTSAVAPSAVRPGQPRDAAAQASPGAVQVSWLSPARGPAPTGYTATPYDSLTGEVAWRSVSITCPCSSLSATIDGLAGGRTYLVAVRASTSAGLGTPVVSPAVTLPRAPDAPSGLRAMPGDGAAVVAWEASAPNGSPVSGYTLTASPGGATATVAGDVTAAAFEGLDNGTAYTFTAVATNAVGTSAASAASTPVTPNGDRGLLAPRNVVAVRGDTEAQVSWDEPTINLNLLGLLSLTQYEVTTHRASDGSVIGTTDAGDDTEVTVTGLRNGTPVYFTVSAQSLLVLNGGSGPSNTVTPAGPPFAPTEVAATRGDGQIDVSWLAPGPRPDATPGDNGDPISGYTATVFRADDNTEVTSTAAPASPTTITGLENGTAYYAKVTATNDVGVGQESSPSNTVTPAGPPFAPTSVTAAAGDGFADVSWTAPDDNGSPITGYTVVVSPGGRRVPVGGGRTATPVTGLDNGATYTFTVVASNDVGDSAPSAPSNAATPVGPPSTPTNVVAVPRDGAVAVQWSPSVANGAPVTYTVTAGPSGASRTTTARSTVVDGLTNDVEYTFVVVASNSAGASATSDPSNPVTPWSKPIPNPPPLEPPADDGCRESTLPAPPAEVYLPSGAVQRQIEVPCRPEMGRVRLGFFIADEEVQLVDGVYVVGDGDGRSFDPNMGPDDNRIYLEIDYSQGTGFIQSNHSCPDKTEMNCKPALSLEDSFASYVRPDGSIFIVFEIGNSLAADTPGLNSLKISAILDILPVADGRVCLAGAVSQFPAVEAYYDKNGSIEEKFTLPQNGLSTVALAFPDRDLPLCLRREMP